jgi:glycosyltransferase involved in cell wall biosynthesis
MNVRIAVVIPTRNRPQLASDAALSLLRQEVPLDIFISDNGSSPEELEAFCRRHPRVGHLRPPSELPMPRHWDWALSETMARSDATHLSVHYDRKISKPGAWTALAEAAAAWPDKVVTFNSDLVSNLIPPRRLWQPLWTGKSYRIATATVARAVADGHIMRFPQAFPVLSNCIVPRPVLHSIAARFGSLCDSTGPDAAFLFRFAALFDDYVHHDRSAGVLYAAERSNGQGYLGGKGGDFGDFMKLHGGKPWLEAAPIPGLSLGQNILYHEYELVRRETGDRLPPLDREAVIADLGEQLRYIKDPRLVAAMRDVLARHGWCGPEPTPLPRLGWRERRDAVATRIRLALGRDVATLSGMPFRSDTKAVDYALRYPRRRQDGADHLALFEPAEL